MVIEKVIKFIAWVRACGGCGRWKSEGIEVFCQSCLRGLFNERRLRCEVIELKNGKKIKLHYFYLWCPNNDKLIRQLVYALKGNWSNSAYRSVLSTPTELNSLVARLKGYVIVPSPPPIGVERDHATGLGHYLAGIVGLPIAHALLRETNESQKKLNLSQRRIKKMKAIKGQKALPKVLLVDDVVTSGSTVEAAYEALGQPPRFEVIALAYRAKLTGKRGPGV